jgi:hypothetical protein
MKIQCFESVFFESGSKSRLLLNPDAIQIPIPIQTKIF